MSLKNLRAAVSVVPNHHLTSAAVAGPKVRSQRRNNSAASSTGADLRPSQSVVGTHRGLDVVQLPSLGPRTMSHRAESTVNTRGATGTMPPHGFPGAGS